MDSYGFQWIPMDSYGIIRIPMDSYGILWIHKDFYQVACSNVTDIGPLSVLAILHRILRCMHRYAQHPETMLFRLSTTSI